MNVKGPVTRSEGYFLSLYLGIWLTIYLLSRFLFEMEQADYSRFGLSRAALLAAPLVVYASLRTGLIEKAKWYAFLGYAVAYGLLFVSSTHYMVVEGNLIYDSLTQPEQSHHAKIIKVRKVFKRKLGFDHTEVTLGIERKELTMAARPYAYFYLKDKQSLQVMLGKSPYGHYVTNINVTGTEKWTARWLHLKDFFYRMRLLWILIALGIIGVLLKARFFPDRPDKIPVRWGFWKIMGVTMAILLALCLMAYAALWVYVLFILPSS